MEENYTVEELVERANYTFHCDYDTESGDAIKRCNILLDLCEVMFDRIIALELRVKDLKTGEQDAESRYTQRS